jgi:hypothetical protein
VLRQGHESLLAREERAVARSCRLAIVLRHAPFAVLAAFLFLVLVQCDLFPRDGASCSSFRGECLSKQDGLFCVGLDVGAGKYRKVRCLGPGGCKEEFLGKVLCDMAKSDVGTPCMDSMKSKAACSDDGKNMLMCVSGEWEQHHRCLGAKACTVDGEMVHCDESVAAEGDECTNEGRTACTLDAKERLVCKDKRMVRGVACTGEKGCHVDGTLVNCDGPAGLPGAPCDTEGASECAADGKTRLSCKDGTLGAPVVCHGSDGCRRADDKIYCDRSRAAEGEPCITEGAPACSVDGTKMLTCKGSVFVSTRSCRSPCAVQGATGPGRTYQIDCR